MKVNDERSNSQMTKKPQYKSIIKGEIVTLLFSIYEREISAVELQKTTIKTPYLVPYHINYSR